MPRPLRWAGHFFVARVYPESALPKNDGDPPSPGRLNGPSAVNHHPLEHMEDDMQNTTLVGLPNTRITTNAELAAAGYLARYRGGTRETYKVSLKLLFGWCAGLGVDPLEGMRRPVLELFARYLEDERHNSPATVAHHLSIVRGYYSFAEIDGYIDRSPAAHIRMPRVYQDESRTMGLDRMELGSVIQAARASSPSDSALIAMMGMLGLRVSEACAVKIEDYQEIERGHRVLRLVGKGGKLCRKAGIKKNVTPHGLPA